VTSTKEIRVAIVGVGNCANSLIQGVHYYRDAPIDQEIPGLMNVVVGGYHVKDVKFVAAFDVDSKKVGLDLVDAMWASENNTIKFAEVPKSGITVLRGETHDGLGRYYKETITESTATPVNVVQALKDAKVDVLVCYLPVGSEVATKFYAQCAIDAGCAFVNALPVFIASTPEWADKFTKAGLPIVGDDIKSQVGATRKWAFVRLEGRAFGDVPLTIEYKLEVWDSPNSAGVIIDAVRCAKLALDRKIGGPLLSPSSYFMKSPPEQYSDEEALNRTRAFIDGKLER